MLDRRLEEYAQSNIYPFHMPGHKRKWRTAADPYAIDITEIDGFDNLHHAEEVLKDAQERAAELYGSKQAYYLVNGSTCGLLAAIGVVPQKGQHTGSAQLPQGGIPRDLYAGADRSLCVPEDQCVWDRLRGHTGAD